MHPHPSPLPSRERGNWIESMSIFGSLFMINQLESGFGDPCTEAVLFHAHMSLPSSLQQGTMAFGRGGMRHRVAGMSSHMGVGKETTGFARGAPLVQHERLDRKIKLGEINGRHNHRPREASGLFLRKTLRAFRALPACTPWHGINFAHLSNCSFFPWVFSEPLVGTCPVPLRAG